MFKHRELLIGHIVLWSLYGLLEHISHIMYGQNHWLGSLSGAVLGGLFTAFLAWINERSGLLNYWIRTTLFAATGFIAAIVWHNFTRFLHFREDLEQVLNSDFSQMLAGSSYSVLLFAAWAGVYFGVLFYLEKQEHLKNSLVLSEQAKEAQLQSLRYQLNPHFLFNVLNSIDVAVLERENTIAHNMLVKLSRLLRVTLQGDASHKITFAQEMSLIDDFVDIEKERYVEKISFTKKISEECSNLLVPSMILQPILENAIKFTWQSADSKHIDLVAFCEGSKLCIEITNPFNMNQSFAQKGTNTGVKNVTERLHAIYGKEAHLKSENTNSKFICSILMPREEALNEL